MSGTNITPRFKVGDIVYARPRAGDTPPFVTRGTVRHVRVRHPGAYVTYALDTGLAAYDRAWWHEYQLVSLDEARDIAAAVGRKRAATDELRADELDPRTGG